MITIETTMERLNIFCNQETHFMSKLKALNYLICNHLQWGRRIIEFSSKEIILEINTIFFNKVIIFKGSEEEMAPLTLSVYAYLLICGKNHIIQGAIKNGFKPQKIPALEIAKPSLHGCLIHTHSCANKEEKKKVNIQTQYEKDRFKIPFIIGMGATTRKEAGKAFQISLNDLGVMAFLLDENPEKTFADALQELTSFLKKEKERSKKREKPEERAE